MNTNTTFKRRDVLRTSLIAGTALALPTWAKSAGANDDIRVAVIGFNGRGAGHISSILKMKGVRLVALCDVDSAVVEKHVERLAKQNIKVKTYEDYRKLVEDPEIDAVTIATPNHTHTIIALTALTAGKHVFVEKPTNHNIHEGKVLLDAARKLEGKQVIVHGMQRRSDLGWAEVSEYVASGALGKILLARGVNYKARQSIGKLAAPLEAPKTVNYNLWCGPREMAPVQRERFHYDWHWQWAYGNGDIGNQGPHQLDVARWNAGNPKGLPRVISFGSRWGYDDDGQTANNQMALYDYGAGNIPLLFDNRGLPRDNMNWQKGNEPVYKGVTRIGNIVHCENGYVIESKAYDNDGKWNGKKFAIQDGPSHMDNFFDSIRAGKLTNPNLDVEHGIIASNLAHLANISYRLGKKVSVDEVKERLAGDKFASETLPDFFANLEANQVDLNVHKPSLGPWVSINPETLKFEGEFADEANKLAASDAYRAEFQLPKI